MTDHHDQLREHWQQLAEQLGLEPAGPSAQEEKEPMPPSSASPNAEVRTSRVEDRELKTEYRTPRLQDEPSEESLAAYSFSKSDAASKVADVEPPVPIPEGPTEISPRQDDFIQEEPQEDRRRRRGRRADSGDRASRGRRGSGTRRREPEPSSSGERRDDFADEDAREIPESTEVDDESAQTQDSVSAEPEIIEDDVDDVDTLSDWNVPSWTELIGSLYRPER
jgi:hypothetical protein